MENENKYEQLYGSLVEYEQKIHEANKRKIRIGLRCIYIIPLCFLILLFWIDGYKTIFLTLWIASLFILAIFLILTEYKDYKLRYTLKDLSGEEFESMVDTNDSQLMPDVRMDSAVKAARIALKRIEQTLNSEEELAEVAEAQESRKIEQAEMRERAETEAEATAAKALARAVEHELIESQAEALIDNLSHEDNENEKYI